MVLIVQVFLGILLFFIMNWIGKHSYSIGYRQITLFLEEEDSPAFNVIYRVLSPVVYIFLLAAVFYKIGFNYLVKNIFLVPLFYLLFRLIFNIVTNRILLINWFRQILQWTAILSISYFSYVNIISVRKNLIPDFSTWSNEIWIIIMIFLFGVLNRVNLSNRSIKKRQNNFIKNRYQRFTRLYGLLVDERIKNEKLKLIVYAVMIYEDFNRPKIIRLIEYLSHILTKKEHTLGLMQTKSKTLINDETSVAIAIDKISESHKQQIEILRKERQKRKEDAKKEKDKLFAETGIYIAKNDYIDDNRSEWVLIRGILKDYNPDSDYISEVFSLQEKISKLFGYSDNSNLWD